MITQLTVGNFRSLGSRLAVSLDPFTVLVGIFSWTSPLLDIALRSPHRIA